MNSDRSVAEYRDDLAKHYSNLGVFYAVALDRDKSEEAYGRAGELWSKLAGEYPAVPEYGFGVSMVHFNLGALYDRNKEMDKAEKAYRESIALREKLVKDHPDVPGYWSVLATSHDNLGAMFLTAGDSEKARLDLLRAVPIRERLARDHPQVEEYREKLASSHINVGLLHIADKHYDQAEAVLKQALAVYENLTREHPANLEYAVSLGGCYCNIGEAVKERDPKGALGWYDKAVATLEGVRARQEGHPVCRLFLVATRIGRAAALARLNEHAAAIKDAEAALKEESPAASSLYELACVYGLASAAAAKDNKLAESERHTVSSRHEDRAAQLLRQAAAAGLFKDQAKIEEIKKESSLTAVFRRPEIQELVQKLERKTLDVPGKPNK